LSQASTASDNFAEQGADFMLKVFVKLTNGVLELPGDAPGMFFDAQIRRKAEDVSAAVRGL
jgi:hypothetical protein